ncbi:MAG: DUF1850 domain-containing protein [Hyphomicrobiaceae bacterium]|nr:DUF1850 domain-containing protein [Hyphomicrobiaceae bacterium]
MPVCLLEGAKLTVVAAQAFTLAWTHTVEKTGWEEDWRSAGEHLELVEARIKGSGAGMEPPEDAKLVDGWWRYHPPALRVPELRLANLGGAAGRWRLCTNGKCREIGADKSASTSLVLAPCPQPPP